MTQIKYSKLENFLRHRDLMLTTAIISTIILTPNTYWVYYSMMKNFAPIWRELVSGAVALFGVTFGILIYTIRGNNKMAYYYMCFEISVSTFYYIITIGWDWWLIPAFSFVIMLPVALKNYTAELNKDLEEGNKDQSKRIADLEEKNNEYSAYTNQLKSELDSAIENLIKSKAETDSHKFTIAAIEVKLTELQTELKARAEENYYLRKELAAINLSQTPEVTPQKNLDEMTESELINMVKSNSEEIPKDLFN